MEPTARHRHLPGSSSIGTPAATAALAPYKARFLDTCLEAQILKFGGYTLKSGRISPYFFNTALFHRADLVRALATAYAEALIAHGESEDPINKLEFDVLFGPAYKGIILATTTVVQLAELAPERFSHVSFSFNRKEAKDHGEGGTVVGAELRGKRIVIIDDVVTAGTAKREAIELIRAHGGTLVAIIVALDRMEKLPADTNKGENDEDGIPRGSAIGALKTEYGVPIISIITLEDLIQGLKAKGQAEKAQNCEDYWKKYRASD
ncbi:MAG: hypothetical protein GOMPHAMPRED_005591 [Gomphillus americanus]|uniref:Orotate phosphoribosyltransferase n=1 Tax=Gomphillus americanus TaxID=1940652 RepID=A0A8H3IWU2_9LECA|nr:MAG: hypothetical protein GOMPHAMPRED_005591 [Gomphillus americanus]